MRPYATFSIVAFDPARQEWGVAVASKFLAAGAVVPWARAGAGAVATQSYANTRFGPEGLARMAEGLSAEETLAALLSEDPEREKRQVGLVDRQGRAAAFTGSECLPWAGHRVGEGFCCQGNLLVDERTLEAMAETFVKTSGELADRLAAALLAGDRAGGDRRGRQSAAILVVREGGGYGGFNDRYMDLRVDDDPDPVVKLKDLVELHHLYFGVSRPEDLLPIDEALAREIQQLLRRAGYYSGEITGVYDEATRRALETLFGIENLEERWQTGDRIDRVAWAFLRRRFGFAEGG
ncbi:DUF1028 domain-containing protein [Thermoflexus sp.]|uniref:DUF1028 domain-containing protein n=1 Tax=Thermoflexus sp. TaxID=1969742 RepID=UPI0025ECDBD7|nr:DUF1028 domain-containing protein [Thermoflexus sp.]MCS6963472.1 DUF1028 domain-containing protein [Thermoflexus sp.]MCX7689734.1 DUF1028 domain-containing protein [Thermoflexus sp.]MDW8185464.1 DUF1028 domain-containing protein [Anaerolineae bacterium]